MRLHAVALQATLVMIKDNGISPQTVCYSDDFFTGHEEISLMKNTLGEALEEGNSQSLVVSDEMMEALRDMRHDKS